MKTFTAQIELSDADYAAMMKRASGATDAQMANSIVNGWCGPYAEADRQEALRQLIPLGIQYDAAPVHIKEQVDALIAPYQG